MGSQSCATDAAARRRCGRVSAVAAAVSGLARNVRPPAPCRPSKLRLLVLTAYWPGWSWSPFMAMHIEQPASRHSAPASRKTRSRPSGLGLPSSPAASPGTTSTRTPRRDLAAREHAARPRAGRERRELVQLPMNTTSTGWPSSGSPGVEAHVPSAFSQRGAGRAGSGTRRADRHAHAGVRAVGDHRLDGRARRSAPRGRSARRRRSAARASARPPRPRPRPAARAAGRRGTRRWCRRARSCPARAPRLDRHVADGHALFHRQRADGRRRGTR